MSDSATRCQAIVMRLRSDLLEALLACAEGRLDDIEPKWHDDPALVVVMAARGYPGKYEKGTEIRGLDRAGSLRNLGVFHAGPRTDGGSILADGGRALGVAARAGNVKMARELAYRAIDMIDWPEGFCRRDIGWRAIDRE